MSVGREHLKRHLHRLDEAKCFRVLIEGLKRCFANGREHFAICSIEDEGYKAVFNLFEYHLLSPFLFLMQNVPQAVTGRTQQSRNGSASCGTLYLQTVLGL